MNEYVNSRGILEPKNQSENAFKKISPYLSLNITIVLKAFVETSITSKISF